MHVAKSWTMTIAGLAAAALLSACAGNGGSTQTTAPEQTSATPGQTATATAQATSPTPSAASGATSDAASQTGIEVGFAAVALAESVVPGSQVIELDRGRSTWEVVAISGDQEFELVINADGTQVLRQEQERADTEDVARLAQAQVRIVDAIRTAMTSVAGEFDEAELDTKRGQVVWEVEIDTPQDVTVNVNAVSGQIVNP